jgi:hypothetical protein
MNIEILFLIFTTSPYFRWRDDGCNWMTDHWNRYTRYGTPDSEKYLSIQHHQEWYDSLRTPVDIESLKEDIETCPDGSVLIVQFSNDEDPAVVLDMINECYPELCPADWRSP